MRVINKPKQSRSTTASNKDKAAYTPQKTISSFLKGLLLFNRVEQSQFSPKKNMQFVRPQEAKLLLYINITYYSSVSVFPTAVYPQTQGTEPSAKACPLNPSSIILHTLDWAVGQF